MHGGLIETLLSVLAQHWVLALTTVTFAWLVRNRFHHGLNKYPGPFLASITDWWRFFDVYGQKSEATLRKLHAKHGDIVRLGPNNLSFSDPSVLKQIYGLSKGYVKVCYRPTDHRAVLTLCSPTFTSFNNPLSKVTV